MSVMGVRVIHICFTYLGVGVFVVVGWLMGFCWFGFFSCSWPASIG